MCPLLKRIAFVRALYLRSSMGQERLSNLALLLIERERTNVIDFDSVIAEFASLKTQKIRL